MGLCYVSEHTGAALDIRRHHIRAQPQSATKSEGQQESDYGGIGHWRATLPACRIWYGVPPDTRAWYHRLGITRYIQTEAVASGRKRKRIVAVLLNRFIFVFSS